MKLVVVVNVHWIHPVPVDRPQSAEFKRDGTQIASCMAIGTDAKQVAEDVTSVIAATKRPNVMSL
jgi:hypothetical protein